MVPASRSARTKPPGLRPDVGTTVTTDLGFVAHATEGDPDELATEGAGHGLAERCLTDSRRADEGQNRSRAAAIHRHQATFGLQLADREVLEDPLFDVVSPS